MTHSLHRMGSQSQLQNDYVILAMLAAGHNDKAPDSRERLIKIARIMKKHNPVNIMTKRAWTVSTVISAAYDDKGVVKEVLREIKEADFGISIVVEGIIDEIKEMANEIGLNLNSAHLSLGNFGKKKLLPSEKVLEITSMCGHHCISPQSVLHYVELIKEQKITVEKAAEKLAKPCICGIFNTERAVEILEELI
ncbi:MAG: hypothetical protein ACOC44_05910 [Promethearchaeia archaeon]